MKGLMLMVSALTLALTGAAAAQDKYPSKPVKIVVPYAPGGATDITSRLFGDQFKTILGQQVVVENKPGAFGILGIEEMARARPDGYTLFVGNVSTNAITPVLFKSKFQINFEKDVVSVSRLAIYPSFLISTTSGLDVKSVKELVEHAKKNPGKVRFTSAGVGSFPHFDMEVFARRAGLDMVHIPNKTGRGRHDQ
jgi:tripartite-type tricarboxylate transporter receptor subunit TctC